MASDPGAPHWESKLAKATGRVLIAPDQYAIIAVTCRVRVPQASTPDEIEEIGEQYLATTSGYAVALGRHLVDAGTPPGRVEVDAECELEGSNSRRHVSALDLVVRVDAPLDDPALLDAAARDHAVLQSTWQLPETARLALSASLLDAPSSRDRLEPEPPAALAQPPQPVRRARPLVRFALLVVLVGAVATYLVTAWGPGAIDPMRLLESFVKPAPGPAPAAVAPAEPTTTSQPTQRPTASAVALTATSAPVITLGATPAAPATSAAIATSAGATALATQPPPTQLPPPSTQAPVSATSTSAPVPTIAPAALEPTATPLQSFENVPASFRETFASNVRQWPNNPQSTAWLANGGYRLMPRQPAQFVAVRAPTPQRFTDVSVSGGFRKMGGPIGGGYGLILRDQSAAPLDGLAQTGQYYVFEVGDKGEFGIWRRNGTDWVEIQGWTPSPAIHAGNEPNELEARADGAQLEFWINGVQVAIRQDTALDGGAVGVFVGGDGNDVLLTDLNVQPLS